MSMTKNFLLVGESPEGRVNIILEREEVHKMIKDMVGRKRKVRLGITFLNFCAFTQGKDVLSYMREDMHWTPPVSILRRL